MVGPVELVKSITDGGLIGSARARVANDPNPGWFWRSWRRGSDEVLIVFCGCEDVRRGPDRIKVLSVWRQASQLQFVLGNRDGECVGLVQRGEIGSVDNLRVRRKVSSPADNNAIGRAKLKVRAAP